MISFKNIIQKSMKNLFRTLLSLMILAISVMAFSIAKVITGHSIQYWTSVAQVALVFEFLCLLVYTVIFFSKRD